MEKIATVRLWKLVDALDLDDETALKLNRYLRTQDDQRAEVMREHHDLHRRVKAFIDAGTDDDAQAAALIEEGIAIEQRSQDLEFETVRGLDDVLTPSQQLRFILANREFEREIAEIVRQHRGGKRGGHGPPPGGP
jgi:Spy/CpxP family protein refolding chaperone